MNKCKLLIMILMVIDYKFVYGNEELKCSGGAEPRVYSFIKTDHDVDSFTDEEKEDCTDYSRRLYRIDFLCSDLIQRYTSIKSESEDSKVETPGIEIISRKLEKNVLELVSLAPSKICTDQIISWLDPLRRKEETKNFYSKLLEKVMEVKLVDLN